MNEFSWQLGLELLQGHLRSRPVGSAPSLVKHIHEQADRLICGGRGRCRRDRGNLLGLARGGLAKRWQKGVDRTVRLFLFGELSDGFLQPLPGGFGVLGVDPVTEMGVGPHQQVADVEGKLEVLFGDHDGGVRPQSMAHPELVDGVGIGCREVGYHNVGAQQQLIHGLVDNPRMNNVVGADTFEAGILHSLLDDNAIGLVKIVGLLLLEVGLLAKSHDDKACLLA